MSEVDVAALRPPKRDRPLIAIAGINDGTEACDYLIPYGILARADVADVVALARSIGPLSLFPAALTVTPHSTLARFDEEHPVGADYVIIPAMVRDEDPALHAWVRSQHDRGAIIIGICGGAKVVAAAGLLRCRRATTHWYHVRAMRKIDPSIVYVPDRRLVIDGSIATTTGITASVPAMLTIVEAIAGRRKAETVAAGIGVENWDVSHDSAAFWLSPRFAGTVIANRLRFWKHEKICVELVPGLDEAALALLVDAWSRTYRSRVTFAAAQRSVCTRNGLCLSFAERSSEELGRHCITVGDKAVQVVDETLASIAHRYGISTAIIVAMQLEYPWSKEARRHLGRCISDLPPAVDGPTTSAK